MATALCVMALPASVCTAEPAPAPASPRTREESSTIQYLVTAENDALLVNVLVELRIESLRVRYDVSLMNRSPEPIALPPVKDTSRPAYLGIEPFWSTWLLIDGKWLTHQGGSPVEGVWRELGQNANSTLFTSEIGIRPGHDVAEGSGAGGTPRLIEVPSMPERMRLRFPYRWKAEERIAEFELALKSIDDHLETLERARRRMNR